MDLIKTAKGVELTTDYLSAIPNPKTMFFRVIGMDFVSVAAIVTDPEQMESLEYGNYIITGCTLNFVSVEGTAVKVSANYTEIREKVNG